MLALSLEGGRQKRGRGKRGRRSLARQREFAVSRTSRVTGGGRGKGRWCESEREEVPS